MSAWLVAYLVGAVLMLVLCGVAIKQITAERLVGSIVTSVMWPITVPFIIGAIIRDVLS